MSDTEDSKLGMAARGFSESDRKLIDAFHKLNLTPHLETSADLLQFITKFGKVLSDHDSSTSSVSHHFHDFQRFMEMIAKVIRHGKLLITR